MTALPEPAVTEDTALEQVIDLLNAARSVTVLSHVHPDADTIGSGLALGLALERRGTPVRVSFAEPAELPASMRTLPGTHLLVPPDQVPERVDLLVAVDCGSAGRLGPLADRLAGAGTSVVIDHHRSNTRFGDLNVVDADAEATASVIARLLDAWGVPIDTDIAYCLFAGLVTDTGSFRWVRPGTHLLAERLLATGIDGAQITRTLMDTHPFAWLPMLSRVLGSAQLVPEAHGGDGLVYAVVRTADIGDLRSEEVESVIDIVRTTSEAKVAVVFKELDPGETWTVSLRSRADVDVAEVATRLGGGGHRFSAGYTAHGPIDDVVAALRDALA